MLPSDLLPPPVFVDVDGVATATYDMGPTDRRPRADVVFCHGTPWSAMVWAPIARALSQEYRVLLWDMPGYGSSSKAPDVAVDLAAQWRRLRRLTQLWAVEGATVIAHDIGGAVALGAHLIESVDFAAIHLLDVVTLDPWGSPFFELVSEHAEVFAALPGDLHRALVTTYIRGAIVRDLDGDTVDQLVEPWTRESGQSAFYRQIRHLHSTHTAEIAARLDSVRCPVSIGWGSDDPWLPVGQAHRLSELLPGTTPVTEFAGVGHLGPLESSDCVGAAIGKWLDQVVSGS